MGYFSRMIRALFFHYPGNEHELRLLPFRIIQGRKTLQIHTGAGQHTVFLRSDLPVPEELPVLLILEEHSLHLAESHLVQHNGDFLNQAAVFHGGAQAGNIGNIGNTHQCCRHTAVNIGLDGIGQNDIRLHFLQQSDVVRQKLQFLHRIHTVAGNGNVPIFAAQCLQILDPLAIGRGNDHLVAIRPEPFHQFQAEIIDHHIVVHQKQNFTHNFTIFYGYFFRYPFRIFHI